MGNSLDRLEIEKRALKGRTFESEDGESQEGAAQIHGYHSFYIFSTYRQDTDEEDHQHHTGHHLPWMGRCPKGGWDDGCLPIHVCEKLIHFFKRQSSPHRFATDRFSGI